MAISNPKLFKITDYRKRSANIAKIRFHKPYRSAIKGLILGDTMTICKNKSSKRKLIWLATTGSALNQINLHYVMNKLFLLMALKKVIG